MVRKAASAAIDFNAWKFPAQRSARQSELDGQLMAMPKERMVWDAPPPAGEGVASSTGASRKGAADVFWGGLSSAAVDGATPMTITSSGLTLMLDGAKVGAAESLSFLRGFSRENWGALYQSNRAVVEQLPDRVLGLAESSLASEDLPAANALLGVYGCFLGARQCSESRAAFSGLEARFTSLMAAALPLALPASLHLYATRFLTSGLQVLGEPATHLENAMQGYEQTYDVQYRDVVCTMLPSGAIEPQEARQALSRMILAATRSSRGIEVGSLFENLGEGIDVAPSGPTVFGRLGSQVITESCKTELLAGVVAQNLAAVDVVYQMSRSERAAVRGTFVDMPKPAIDALMTMVGQGHSEALYALEELSQVKLVFGEAWKLFEPFPFEREEFKHPGHEIVAKIRQRFLPRSEQFYFAQKTEASSDVDAEVVRVLFYGALLTGVLQGGVDRINYDLRRYST